MSRLVCTKRGCSGTLIESAWKPGELWCRGNPHWIDKDKVQGLSPSAEAEEINESASKRTETLTCQECGDDWEREIKRGRKPSTCPDC